MSSMKLINSESIRNYAESSIQTYYAIIEGNPKVQGLSRTKENAILKKEQSVSYIYGKIDLQQVPNIDDSRAIMKECMVTYNKEKRKIKNEVDAVIRQKYGKLIDSVNIDDFSEESRGFSFSCSLSITLKYKGNL